MKRWFQAQRALIGRFAFELVIVFVGVTAAFALENLREGRDEDRYRARMVGALRESLSDYTVHGADIDRRIGAMLRDFDAARARGERPPLPVYREYGGERPPTRAWDGVVATGAARALEPRLFFRLAVFFNRADSFGERYIRYNNVSEDRVLPYMPQPGAFYDGNGLKPEYAAYVERLRDLQREDHAMAAEAGRLRAALPR